MYEATQAQIIKHLETVRDNDGRDGSFRIDLRQRAEGNYNLRPIAVTPAGQEIPGELITADMVEDLVRLGNISPIRDQLTRLARKLPIKKA